MRNLFNRFGAFAERNDDTTAPSIDSQQAPTRRERGDRASILVDSLVGIFIAVGFATVSISGFALVFESVALHETQAQLYDLAQVYQGSFSGNQSLPTAGTTFFANLNSTGQATYCDFSDLGCAASDFTSVNGTRLAFAITDTFAQTDPGQTYNSFLNNVSKFSGTANSPNAGTACNNNCTKVVWSSNGSYYAL